MRLQCDIFPRRALPLPVCFRLSDISHFAAVNHRKAVESSSAFPAQLLDLLAGYAYLLSHGFLPENITFLGDSSGGHLVLALSRYLAELDAAVPELNVGMPGALMLISVSGVTHHSMHRPTHVF